ncbi:unnamed protein product [Diamesa serratosioi]
MKCDLGFNYDQAMKRQDHSPNEINKLRNKLNSLDNVSKSLTNKQILLFLDSCGGVEGATRVMKIYYDIKKTSPEHFSNRDPENLKIQQCLQHQDYFHLPCTPDGSLLIFHRLSSPKASHYMFDEALKTFFMTIDSCLQTNGPKDGAIFLFDMKGVGLMHLTRINLSSIKKFFQYLQEGVPGKLKAIHILNVVSFFDKILSLIKPFIKADILQNMHLHPSSMNMEKFYKDHIPKSCLPSDFGGDLESVEVLHEKHCKEFKRLQPIFIWEEQQAALKLDFHEKPTSTSDLINSERNLKKMTIE